MPSGPWGMIFLGIAVIVGIILGTSGGPWYHYEGEASFWPDTANDIISYGGNSSIVGVSTLNVNMIDVRFDFSTRDRIPYLLSEYGELKKDDLAIRIMVPILEVMACLSIVLGIYFLCLLRGKKRK